MPTNVLHRAAEKSPRQNPLGPEVYGISLTSRGLGHAKSRSPYPREFAPIAMPDLDGHRVRLQIFQVAERKACFMGGFEHYLRCVTCI